MALGTDDGVPGPPDDRAGQIIAGRYLVTGTIGEGGMGMVLDCENLAIGRRVAIKILHPEHAVHGEAVERFHREARASSRIGHPGIVDVLDLGRTGDVLPFMTPRREADASAASESARPVRPRRGLAVASVAVIALAATLLTWSWLSSPRLRSPARPQRAQAEASATARSGEGPGAVSVDLGSAAEAAAVLPDPLPPQPAPEPARAASSARPGSPAHAVRHRAARKLLFDEGMYR